MLIKDKLSRISLQSLILSKKTPPVIATEEPLSSSPFVMPKSSAAEVPFTGRVKELDLLRSLYRELIGLRSASGRTKNTQSKPLIIGIKGEAGIGKSRLVTEFQNNITAFHNGKSFIYRAGCLSSGQEAYGLFRGFFSGSNFLKQAATSERKTLIQNKISGSILSLAREAAKNNLPMVIMLEDMQWADELSLSALDHFVSALSMAAGEEGLMLLLILNYRPSYRPGRVIRKECRFVEIELKGFGEIETKQFISKLTGRKNISPNILEQISRRSEGNPFNIEEICRSLDAGFKNLKIPATVKGLLVDKVSQLEKDERSVLIIASVLGRKFSLKLLNAILKKAGKQPAGTDVMKRLEEKKYLVNLTSDVYEFRHDLLHEIVYRELKKDLRKNVHALAAAATEEVYSTNLDAHYYELARHYEAAGDEVNTNKYLEVAGNKAWDNYENRRAERYFVKLLRSNFVKREIKYISLLKIADLHMRNGKWSEAKKIYEKTSTDVKNLNMQLLALNRLSNLLLMKGNYTGALHNFRRILRKDRDGKLTADCLKGIGKIFLERGDNYKAGKYFNAMLENARSAGNQKMIANAYESLGRLKRIKGKYEDAVKNYQLCEMIYLEQNDKTALCSLYNKIGSVYFGQGLLSEALSYFDKSRILCEQIGNRAGLLSVYSNIGVIYLSRMMHSRSTEYFRKLLILADKLGDDTTKALAFTGMGNNSLNAGKYEDALIFFNKSWEISVRSKRKNGISNTLSSIGVVNYYLGSFSKALYFFRKQIHIDKKIENYEGIIRGFVNIGIVMKNTGRTKLAERSFKKAITMASENQSKRLLCVARYNYSEMLFDEGWHKLAFEQVRECILIAGKQKYPEEFYAARSIGLLSDLYLHFGRKPLIHNEILELKRKICELLKESASIEHKAKIHYELWKFTRMNRSAECFFQREFHKSEALKHYSELVKTRPHFLYIRNKTNLIKEK